jgi:hypothetical protein
LKYAFFWTQVFTTTASYLKNEKEKSCYLIPSTVLSKTGFTFAGKVAPLISEPCSADRTDGLPTISIDELSGDFMIFAGEESV